ncbi:MAG: type II secretion system protein [Pirellulales bacterium]
MADSKLSSGSCRTQRSLERRPAASLIELLVVLFIIGVMLGLLLPALSGARAKANDTKCMNNLRNVSLALDQSIYATKKFPERGRWPIAVLRWIEEAPLYDAMKNDKNADAEYPRPPVFRCPFQEDFSSRVENVGFCHFVLVVDRPKDPRRDRRLAKDVRWDMMDRKMLTEDPEKPEQPWYIGPEMSYVAQAAMLANEPGPHPEGKYMTPDGRLVP